MQTYYFLLRLHASTVLLWFFICNIAIAQSEMSCGNLEAIDVSDFELDRIEQPCFDLEEIIENCTPVYLRVNFHLFVNDDCTGAFDPNHITSALPQEAAFYEATQPGNRGIPERMIYEMNQRVINNQPQKLKNGEYAESAPVFHCDLYLAMLRFIAIMHIEPKATLVFLLVQTLYLAKMKNRG